MSIMKMEMVNIVGLTKDFNRIVFDYVLKSNIHPENVFTVLENVKGMYAYAEDSNLGDLHIQASCLLELAGINEEEVKASDKYRDYKLNASSDTQSILNELLTVRESIESLEKDKIRMYDKLSEYDEIRKQLYPIEKVDVNLNRLFEFEFIKLRFGKMPVKSYKILNEYLDNMDTFFLKTSGDEEYVWGVYFIPGKEEEKIDAIFSSLYFERVRISNNVHGTPRQSLEYLDGREAYRKGRLKEIAEQIIGLLYQRRELIVYAKEFCEKMIEFQKIKKYAGHTKDSFYIVGWMTKKDADILEREMKNESNVVFLKEHPNDVLRVKPPTKLKNLFFIKPFEMFVKMYGLPSYSEFDPTWIFALSYFIMFGAMFGDVGQGFILLAGGFLFAKLKKSSLGTIIGTVGISSIIFGFIYGSIFGNEEIIQGYIKPMERIMDVLIYAVYFGVGIILFVIFINILVGIKNKDAGRALFSQNGLAGFVFYALTVFVVLYIMKYNGAVGLPVLLILLGMLLIILLQEPLSRLVKHKKNWMPEKKGMFILEAFFELFEIVLSFITNTLSFLRVGAFALIHVGMMGVVKILAGMMGGGSGDSIIVLILGNILIIALEGLVVGIQTLRLEFYEMFNRFYSGDGKEFKSIRDN